jgi:hypothetical protein
MKIKIIPKTSMRNGEMFSSTILKKYWIGSSKENWRRERKSHKLYEGVFSVKILNEC